MNQYHIHPSGLEIIKQYKKFSKKRYVHEGHYYIGFEHLLTKDEQIHFPVSISENFAETLLKQDLIPYEQQLRSCLIVELNQNQFSALVSLINDIGILHFSQSKLLNLINQKAFSAAAQQFFMWSLKNITFIRKRELEKQLFLQEV